MKHDGLAMMMGLLLGCGGTVSTSGGNGGAAGHGPTTSAGTNTSSNANASASAGAGSATGGTTASSTGSGGTGCVNDTDCANSGTTCCGGVCVNTRNDIKNCGACGVVCPANMNFCDGTGCVAPPCNLPTGCDSVCCGNACC